MDPNLADLTEFRSRIVAMLFSLPKPHFSPAVTVTTSEISGYGLVATRAIEPGEILVVELGPRMTGHVVRMIEAFTGFESNCCIGWGEYVVHAPLRETGPGGYINHSCDPNAGMLADATWAAIRPIAAGEEVTCDYGTFETARDWQMTCRCGTQRCRGIASLLATSCSPSSRCDSDPGSRPTCAGVSPETRRRRNGPTARRHDRRADLLPTPRSLASTAA